MSEHCYYVSVDGDDTFSGKSASPDAQQTDGPFATLVRARDAIRGLKASSALAGPVKVMLRGGIYCLSEPLVLEPEDSGTKECPIAYTAYPGESPVIRGSVALTGWEPHEGAIMRCALPESGGRKWKFRQLFLNGERQIRARWPRRDPADPLYGGWAFIEAAIPDGNERTAEFRYEPTQPPRQWSRPDLAEMLVFPWYCWVNDIIPLVDADPAERRIRVARPPLYPSMTLLPGNRFIVENVLEELRGPGEWCLDHEQGIVYYQPPAELGENDRVTVPVTERLIELSGTPAAPVQFVHISGLTFTETLSLFPDHDSCGAGWHSPTQCGGSVCLENAEDCRVDDNVFRAVGDDAVRLHGHSARNRVAGNDISWSGASGVSLASEASANAGTWTDAADLKNRAGSYIRVEGNVITNNHIHHCGVLKKNCAGVQVFGITSVDNVISHNRIHHTSDKGITIQDGFGPLLVECNELHDIAREICDTGAIMVNRWFALEDDEELRHGSVFRFNLIRNVIGCGAYHERRKAETRVRTKADGKIWSPYYTWGIYFDNSGMRATVFGNIIIGTVLGGVCTPVGDPKQNRIENNIMVGGLVRQADLRISGGSGTGNRFRRNILCCADGGSALFCISANTSRALAECDCNVYFAAGAEPGVDRMDEQGNVSVMTLEQWRERGFDAHSVVADPMFVDPDHGDYTLSAESPALALGFQPIDVSRIGQLPRGECGGRNEAGVADE